MKKKLKQFKRRFEDRFSNPAFAMMRELFESAEISFTKDSARITFRPRRKGK